MDRKQITVEQVNEIRERVYKKEECRSDRVDAIILREIEYFLGIRQGRCIIDIEGGFNDKKR